MLIYAYLSYLTDTYRHRFKFIYQRLDFCTVFRGEVAEDGIAWLLWLFSGWSLVLPQQQVGNVNVCFPVLGCGVLFEIAGYADVEAA